MPSSADASHVYVAIAVISAVRLNTPDVCADPTVLPVVSLYFGVEPIVLALAQVSSKVAPSTMSPELGFV